MAQNFKRIRYQFWSHTLFGGFKKNWNFGFFRKTDKNGLFNKSKNVKISTSFSHAKTNSRVELWIQRMRFILNNLVITCKYFKNLNYLFFHLKSIDFSNFQIYCWFFNHFITIFLLHRQYSSVFKNCTEKKIENCKFNGV